MGGFLQEENLPHFTNFCTQMEKEFREYVDMWVTFNEPAVVCLTGHVFGIFPPGVSPQNFACLQSLVPFKCTSRMRTGLPTFTLRSRCYDWMSANLSSLT